VHFEMVWMCRISIYAELGNSFRSKRSSMFQTSHSHRLSGTFLGSEKVTSDQIEKCCY
jgi:hypothetical protein